LNAPRGDAEARDSYVLTPHVIGSKVPFGFSDLFSR
jgi:hypothetical protein